MLVKHIQLASYSKLQFLTQVTLQLLILADEVSGNVNDFTDLRINKAAKDKHPFRKPNRC